MCDKCGLLTNVKLGQILLFLKIRRNERGGRK